MGDPVPAPILDRPADPLIYRPLSGLALAGFALACLFAVLVLATTLLALVRGVPFFLPTWVALLPAGGAVLSWLGRRHIRNSEGTRAGETLARWGLGLSVFIGLGYYAYVTFTGLALTQQAHTFLTVKDEDAGFFPRVAEGGRQLNYAFLLTLPPAARVGSQPHDDQAMYRQYNQPTGENAKAPLAHFLTHPLVVTISSAGEGNVRVEPLGVKEWKYENAGYHVLRAYRVHTPEAVMEVLVPVQSAEGREGEPRRWFVNAPEMRHLSIEYTELGKTMRDLRASAARSVTRLTDQINQGKGWEDFADKDQTQWDKIIPNAKLRQQLRGEVAGMFQGRLRLNLNISVPLDEVPRGWKQVDGRIQLALPLSLKYGDYSIQRMIQGDGTVYVESEQAYDPRNPPPQPPQWKIVGIRLDSLQQMAKEMGPPAG